MLVLITYDVNTEDSDGKRRLRKVAKECVNYGVRVQNSVFECVLDAGECRKLVHLLTGIIDKKKDSLRVYYLGKKENARIEVYGCKTPIDVTEPLIF